MSIKGETMYKVSVVIPVYNGENYISTCLDSLVNQTLQELEVIVINDGSTDRTLDILNQYKQDYPKLFKIYSIENSGQGVARNIGITYATGDFLAFVDSDDYVAPEVYEQLYNYAKKNCYDLVVYPYYRVTAHKKIQTIEMTKFNHILDLNTSPWNKLFHRQTWLDYEIKFAQHLWYEDVLAIYSYALIAKKVGFYPQPLYYYVFRKNSSINLYSEKTKDIFIVFNQLIDYAKKNNLFNQLYSEIEAMCLLHLVLGHLSRCIAEKSFIRRHHLIKETKTYIKSNFPEYSKNPFFRLNHPLSTNNRLTIIKFSCLKAFKYNFFDGILWIYCILHKLKININKW